MRPPAAARALVRLLTDAADRHFLLKDLAERFEEVARTDGLRAARRWYWRQALSVVPWAARARLDRLRWRSWTGMAGDLRSGARTLARDLLYAAGVSGTIALGVAAATLAFAVTWRVWLAPLPLPDPDRVVRLYEIKPPGPGAVPSGGAPESRRQRLSTTLLGDLHAHAFRTVEAVSWVATPQRTWIREGERQAVAMLELSPEGLGILGVVPLLGRLPAAPQGGEATEILLSERFWRTAFGGDPDAIGSQMTLAGSGAATVVGVARLPSGYPGDADVVRLLPWAYTAAEDRGFRHVEAIARVRPGHSVAAAEEELNAFLAALAERHPEHRGWRLEAAVLGDDLVRPFRAVPCSRCSSPPARLSCSSPA
jgi:putative ABC transport system permease protein